MTQARILISYYYTAVSLHYKLGKSGFCNNNTLRYELHSNVAGDFIEASNSKQTIYMFMCSIDIAITVVS